MQTREQIAEFVILQGLRRLQDFSEPRVIHASTFHQLTGSTHSVNFRYPDGSEMNVQITIPLPITTLAPEGSCL